MKCIKCNVDNNLKDRNASQGVCKSCRHPFTFDPKRTSGVDFTDRFFANAISGISANETLFFTLKQFLYFFNARKLKAKNQLAPLGFVALVIGVIFFVVGAKSANAIPILIGFGFFTAGVTLMIPKVVNRFRRSQTKELTIAQNQVEKWVKSWSRNNGPLTKLLPPPARKTGRAEISPEIKQYSFDRVVVCEHAAVAHFLIANNFHFEHNCAVLSIDKYPHDLFDTIMEMLRRNPALNVYALHDASPVGVEMTHKLASDPDWFLGSNVQIHDLGILPRQIIDKSVFVRTSDSYARSASNALSTPTGASMRPEEAQWLREGKYVELESVSPRVLLRVVTQGITRSKVPDAQGALVPFSTESYGDDVYIFAYDSFG